MTLATETLNLWRNNAEITAGETAEDDPEHIAAKAILVLTAELLANREAQPVAWQETLSRAAKAFEALLETAGHFDKEVWADVPAQLRALTAPPAPAVLDDVQHLKNVQELYHSQEERLFALAQRIKGASFDKYSHTTAQAIDVLEREIFGDDDNACRAAMLAQPVSQGYKLPDGWIACSERMPDDGVVVLCHEGGGVSTLFHRGNGVWDDGDFHSNITGVTHWMPLPAVPGVVK